MTVSAVPHPRVATGFLRAEALVADHASGEVKDPQVHALRALRQPERKPRRGAHRVR